jgi:hypothetical protein
MVRTAIGQSAPKVNSDHDRRTALAR